MIILKMKHENDTPVDTLEQASRIYSKRRDESGEGASTFNPGKVLNDKYQIIGYISYNGKVWSDHHSTKLLFDPFA